MGCLRGVGDGEESYTGMLKSLLLFRRRFLLRIVFSSEMRKGRLRVVWVLPFGDGFQFQGPLELEFVQLVREIGRAHV